MDAKCPVCRGKGVEDDHLTCAYCGGDGNVSEEARRQYLEYLLKEPMKPETIKGIFKPIRPEADDVKGDDLDEGS